jgi:osmoprotectant transport system substrate-binding protein
MASLAACRSAQDDRAMPSHDQLGAAGSQEQGAAREQVADDQVAGAGQDEAAANAAEGSDIGIAAGGPIAVGSTSSTESVVVSELYSQALEAAGFQVERRLNLGATDIAHDTLVAGLIDLYPEYTSAGALRILELEPMTDKDEVMAAVRDGYQEQFDLLWLEPAPFNNPQALATRADVASEYGIASYSDLAEAAPDLIIGGPPEFFEREDGLPGLQAHYGGFEFKEAKQLDPGLRYRALNEGDIDVLPASGTAGQISGYELVLLDDDKSLYPPYQVAPVVRQETLERFPDVAVVLNAIAPLLTSAEMQRLNWMVDGPDKLQPADVAREFLQEQGVVE